MNTENGRRVRAALLALAALFLLGVLLALLASRFGPGASGDSSSYLMGAENLLAGNGYSRFSGGYELRAITGFPPFFSAVLAALTPLASSPIVAARWLNAVTFGASGALITALVYRATASYWASLIAGLLFLLRDVQVDLHAWVMSEPLYIFLTLLASFGLVVYLISGKRVLLVTAGIVAGLAVLTRYAGLALIAAGGLALLAYGHRKMSRRLSASAVFSGIGLLPFFLWAGRNSAIEGNPVNRALGYHQLDPALLRLFLADLSDWFVPHELPLPTALRAAIALAVALAIALASLAVLKRSLERSFRRPASPDREAPDGLDAVVWVIGLYVLFSAAVLWANSTFLDAGTTAAAPPRYLAPVYAGVVILAVSVGTRFLRSTPALRWLALACVAVVLAYSTANTISLLRDPLPHMGYTVRRHAWGELVSLLQNVPSEVPIVSNNPEMIYVLIGRPAYVRPISYDQYQDTAREDYEEQFEFLEAQLEDGGIFVLFDELEPDDRAMIERFDLEIIEQFENAQVYRHPEGPKPLPSEPNSVVRFPVSRRIMNL